MATSQASTVTKIYEIQIVGFEEIDRKLKELAKDFVNIKKAKDDLDKQKTSAGGNTKELDDINKKLAEQALRQKEITKNINEQREARLRLKLADEQAKTNVVSQTQGIGDDNSIKRAREENKALRAERDLLNTADAEGAKRIAEINIQIDQNNKLIEKNVDLLAKQKINIGNYQGSAKLVVDALKKIEDEITKVTQQQAKLTNLQKTDPIGFKLAGGQENLNKTSAALSTLTTQATALGAVTSNPKFFNVASRFGDATTEARFFGKALADLRAAGQTDTEVFAALEARVAKLTDDLADNRAEIKALASDTRQFDLVAQGFQAMTDGAQLFIGAQALLGKSNENVQKSIQTLLAVQNIATAARSLATQATTQGTLANKAYSFVLAQVKVLTDANAASSAKWMATLKLGIIGAIITAVALLIANMDKLNGKQKELQKGLLNLQGVSRETQDELVSMGKTIDEVADTSIKNLEEATKSLNAELGKTPTVVETAEGALQLLNNRLDDLTENITKNTFSFTRLLQGIGGVQAINAQLEEIVETGDKIDAITNKVEKFKRALQSKDLNDQIKDNFTDIQRTADLQIDANNRILAKEKASLKDRSNALKSNLAERKKIIDAQRSIEILDAGKDKLKVSQATEKADADKLKAERDFQDQMRALVLKGNAELLANTLATIDARRDQLLALERNRITQIQKVRALSLDEQIDNINTIEAIEVAALDKKIALFQAKKSLDAQELKQLAEFQASKADLELKGVQQVEAVREEEFKRRAEILKNQLEADTSVIQAGIDKVANDPQSTAGERARAKAEGDQAILDLQLKLNRNLDALQKELNVQTVDNAKIGAKELTEQQQKINEDRKAQIAAIFADITTEAQISVDQININFAKLRKAILDNDKLTVEQRAIALRQLDALFQHDLLASELERTTKEFNEIKRQLLLGLATYRQYLDAKKKMDDAANALATSEGNADFLNAEVKRLKKAFKEIKDQFKQGLVDEAAFFAARTALRKAEKEANQAQAISAVPSAQSAQTVSAEGLRRAFGFDRDSEENKLLGEVIGQSFTLAQDAMNSYFDAEEQRIQQNLDLQLQRVEVEKQQRTVRAQSQAEIESINKQAAAKETALRRQAGEQLKKTKLAEAKISLATELANIAASAAANPLNGVTFGAAGAIMYGILAALAVARYALNVSNISRQQFASGGEVPRKGGKFGGKPHAQGGTSFVYQDREYEAEVDELAVIRTRNAPKDKRFTVTGTQTQIASAINKIGGGDDFAPGASIEEDKRPWYKKIFDRGGFTRLDSRRIERISDNKTSEKTEKFNANRSISELIEKIFTENGQKLSRVEISLISRKLLSSESVTKEESKSLENKFASIRSELVDSKISRNKKESVERSLEVINNLISNDTVTSSNDVTNRERNIVETLASFASSESNKRISERVTKVISSKKMSTDEKAKALFELVTRQSSLASEEASRIESAKLQSERLTSVVSNEDIKKSESNEVTLKELTRVISSKKTSNEDKAQAILEIIVARRSSSSSIASEEDNKSVSNTIVLEQLSKVISSRKTSNEEKAKALLDIVIRRSSTSSEEANKSASKSAILEQVTSIIASKTSSNVDKKSAILDLVTRVSSSSSKEDKAKNERELNEYYSSIVSRITREDSSLLERQDSAETTRRVLEIVTRSREDRSIATLEAIEKIVTERLASYTSSIFKVSGTNKQIYSRLDRYAREKLAFGGHMGKTVPLTGGRFGGRPHAEGGTPFVFRGKQYEAEVEELAIIRTKNAPKNKRYSLSGTQTQIASALNVIGGGRAFAAGASISKDFATGGVLGSSLEAPIFVPSNVSGNDDAILDELKRLNDRVELQTNASNNLIEETSKRIDRIQTFVVTKEISEGLNKDRKQTAVGTLPAKP